MQEELLKFINKDNTNFDETMKKIISLDEQKSKPFMKNLKDMEEAKYNLYTKVKIKDIQILISNTDRTQSFSDRFQIARTLKDYYTENRDRLIELFNRANIDKVKEIGKMQNEFSKKIPYFLKYDGNYLWQIYYSKQDKRYFMLFPSKEEDTSALMYLFKKKLENSGEYIYVPICNGIAKTDFINSKEMEDLSNYIWLYTKKWPEIKEYDDLDGNKKVYIVGKTVLEDELETKYRIIIDSKEKMTEIYTLLKALFIISTETNFGYNFETNVDENGELMFLYKGKKIDILNLQDFVNSQTSLNKELKKLLNVLIRNEKREIENFQDIIDRQNKIYEEQEKQIEMFMSSRNSFFKKLKVFFKNNKKLSEKSKVIIDESRSGDSSIIEESENLHKKVSKKEEELSKSSNTYTISDLVKVCIETKDVSSKEQDLKADLTYLIQEKNNLRKKIENADLYLNEIDKHKKNIFEFWKFTNDNDTQELGTGAFDEDYESSEAVGKFDLNEDFYEFAKKVDNNQRKKLSEEEQDAVFAGFELIDSFNSVATNKNMDKLENEFKKLKKDYEGQDEGKKLFGNILSSRKSSRILRR